jgi:uncharacterized C2H2 Zn-finger protein
MRMCHSFSINCVSENEGAERSVKLVAGKIETRKWLHGPACALDKTVMYPCNRYRCRVPCPCKICNKHPPSCTVKASCNCSDCKEQFEDHKKFHAACHNDCKFCIQLLQMFPAFNFFFMNSEGKKVINVKKFFDNEDFKYVGGPEFTLEETRINKKMKDTSNSCNVCDCRFKTMWQLKEHIVLNHECGERFSHEYHEVDVGTVSKHCEKCDEEFLSRKEFVRHVKAVHYWEDFPCDLCEEVFSRKDSLARHVTKIHNPMAPLKKGDYKCPKCGKQFGYVLDFLRHKKHVHCSSNEYLCEICNRKFNRKDNFDRHIKSSLLPDDSPRYKCNDCEQTFCTAKFLNGHQKSSHSILSCEDCEEKFAAKNSLKRHKLNRSNFFCDECEQILCNKVSLDRHKNIHNEVKCDECGGKYYKSNIMYHKLWSHEHKKP